MALDAVSVRYSTPLLILRKVYFGIRKMKTWFRFRRHLRLYKHGSHVQGDLPWYSSCTVTEIHQKWHTFILRSWDSIVQITSLLSAHQDTSRTEGRTPTMISSYSISISHKTWRHQARRDPSTLSATINLNLFHSGFCYHTLSLHREYSDVMM
jgi:hypothetical protein